MSLLDLFGKDANFFGGRTSEQRARGAGQIAYESIPGISEAVTYRDIKSELKKDKPNYFTIGLLAGAGALGLLPFVGDIAGNAIRQGVKARNAVKLTPAQQQSQNIINLLKSGKANEVTDQMLANADQKYLFENYDLPMDTQSRMARAKEMGLLDDSFHGTYKSFDSHDYHTSTADDIKIPMGKYGNAFFSSDNPNVANTYGDIIYPIKTRSKDAKYNVDAKGENWQEIPLNEELEMDFGLALGDEPTSTNMIVDLVNANRPDIKQVKFNNVIDRGSSYPKNLKGNTSINQPSTVTASLMDHDPLVRSRFARFDPRLKHLKNLSAGFIPIGLLPFLMNEEQQ